MKVFIVTTDAEISAEDIKNFIWVNVDGTFALRVDEIKGDIENVTIEYTLK